MPSLVLLILGPYGLWYLLLWGPYIGVLVLLHRGTYIGAQTNQLLRTYIGAKMDTYTSARKPPEVQEDR